jgi:hypothetical protein
MICVCLITCRSLPMNDLLALSQASFQLRRSQELLRTSTAMSLAIQELLPKLVDSLVSLRIHVDALQSLTGMQPSEFSPGAGQQVSKPPTHGPAATRATAKKKRKAGSTGARRSAVPPRAKSSKASTRKGAKGARTGVGSHRQSSSGVVSDPDLRMSLTTKDMPKTGKYTAQPVTPLHNKFE